MNDARFVPNCRCFFDEWGTHYTKAIDFGGLMMARSNVDGEAWSNSK